MIKEIIYIQKAESIEVKTDKNGYDHKEMDNLMDELRKLIEKYNKLLVKPTP